MSTESFAFKIGDFNCLAVRDLDWVSVLLIDTGRQRVLVDTGCGYTNDTPGQLTERLQAAGVAAADIDVVVLSHADGDHIGGAVAADGNLAFAKARHVLSLEEWAFWESKPVRLRRELNTFFDEAFFQWSLDTPRVLWPLIREKFELIEAGDEIVPGVGTIAAPGHTPGSIAVSVSSGSEKLLFVGDVIYGADLSDDSGNGFIVSPASAWHAFVDMDSAQADVTRERLFEQAARERTLLMVPHVQFHGLGYVAADGQQWRWQPHHTDG